MRKMLVMLLVLVMVVPGMSVSAVSTLNVDPDRDYILMRSGNGLEWVERSKIDRHLSYLYFTNSINSTSVYVNRGIASGDLTFQLLKEEKFSNFLYILNYERRYFGIPELRWHAGVAAAAQDHAEDLSVTWEYRSNRELGLRAHTGIDGSSARDRIFRYVPRNSVLITGENVRLGGLFSIVSIVYPSGITYSKYFENRYGIGTVILPLFGEGSFLAWSRSVGHRAAMMSDFDYIGLGFVPRCDSLAGGYIVAKFMSKR